MLLGEGGVLANFEQRFAGYSIESGGVQEEHFRSAPDNQERINPSVRDRS
ncbi:MAG: hypothetical protein FJ042_00215 [Candidatus Cloacimonetes bacterium]|nr:hypothetical protein [Candidatus Cloacimonadota bacterium]